MSQRPVEEILSRLQGVKQGSKGWTARCPGHDDKESSLSLDEGKDGRVLINCFVGCKPAIIVSKIGLELKHLFPPSERPRKSPTKKADTSVTLAALAADKALPEAFLQELGLRTVLNINGREIVRIPYLLMDGTPAPRQRLRTALRAKDGSIWTKGKEPTVPYGLWKLSEARQAGFLVLVEGESDTCTLWLHGFPALGMPGASSTRTLKAEYLEGIGRIYVLKEPDKGGEIFLEGVARILKELGWSGQAFEVLLGEYKDPNELHKKDPEGFKTAFQSALDQAGVLAAPTDEAAPDDSGSAHSDNPGRFFLKSDFLANVLAQEILEERSFLSSPIDEAGKGVRLLIYEGGLYQPGESIARSLAHERLGYRSKPDRIDSSAAMIRESTKAPDSKLNPKAMDLINLENGMLEWRTSRLLPHSKDYLSTYQIHAAYAPDASCPMIDRFLEEVFPKDALPLAQEMLGYLLLPTTRHQKAFMLVGAGANGKSTFLTAVEEFIGRENVSHIALQEMSENRFAAAELLGKLANIYPDLPAKALEQSDIFKAVTTGDVIKAERKFQHPFCLRPHARLLFSANELPPSKDMTSAFFRRWHVIPFLNVFKGNKADRGLSQKLSTPEARSALLNHALTGLRRLEAQIGFSECASVMEATENYRRQCDNVYEFANEVLQAARGQFLVKEETYKAYKAWCEEAGISHPLSQKNFNKRLCDTMGIREGRQVLDDGKKHRVWEGLAWVEDQAGPGRPGSSHLSTSENIADEAEPEDGEIEGEKSAEPGLPGLGRSHELPVSLADWPAYWRDLFEERAGVLEFEEGLARYAAEKRAETLLRDEYARQNNHSLTGMGGHL